MASPARLPRLKWHRARKTASDVPFTATRILEGLRLGASVEVDLLVHADGGFAILHDAELADSTTGRGKVRKTPAATLRTLELLDAQHRPCGEPVLLLEDLADLLSGEQLPADALLQLDFKDTARALDRQSIAAFAAAVEPIAEHLILSCGDAKAVRLLTGAAPGVAVGYDPCHRGAVDRVLVSGRFARFVEKACAASPRATTIYLEIRLVTAAADRGFDVIDAFHARGREVDAYTFYGAANPGMVPVATRLVGLGVDQLTVDDPEGLAALLG
ncbi:MULTISPECIES: glycerophosphodiester phosphodiesterase [unclassified Gordonia (in: high G+C Gram-positive bacteria)]|uniref:glycerophosphodiester phosphodiesterase n=1 Tax=unclassified Gordonia (in: high G+C Gram-positive bacteria) TaxID=2657482 RepID=UPI001FFE3C4B|nr:glycerophosphodiester phosphodiesterase family protein [Gordonia sp. PP30]UQE75704.1 glycerophosphodiester phosphodiesterase [Gordonia sp. PP30]